MLEAVTHFDDATISFIHQFTKAKRMPHQAVSFRGPGAGVSIGTSPPLVPMAKFYRNMRDFLLENCALTQVALHRLGRTHK